MPLTEIGGEILQRLTRREWGLLERTSQEMDRLFRLTQNYGSMNMVVSNHVADGSYIENWTSSLAEEGEVTVDPVLGVMESLADGQYLIGVSLALDVSQNSAYHLTVEFGNGESMVIDEMVGIRNDIITMSSVYMTGSPFEIRAKMDSDNNARAFTIRTGQIWVNRIG
jgi:hypothetical protein